MSHYLPFARKYRPKEFKDLIGQDVLVKTITESIKNGRYPSGIILSGIRGVGKTTSARIIAKIINCSNFDKDTLSSCNKCSNCIAFNNNNHPDIIEMDAASATGVDDVRQIIDSAEYKPLIATKKIYIIDEVHMFSKSAFNALLKILEEPPLHLMFIFATTELEKIPITILSRCQKFYLKRINPKLLTTLLENICTAENIQFSMDALELIAIKSEGSARDAVSMLDQASLSAKDNLVDTQLVSSMIGIGNVEDIVKYFISIITKEVEDAIQIIKSVYDQTNNLANFVENIIHLVSYATKLKILPEYKNSIYAEYLSEITQHIKTIELSHLCVIWQIFAKNVAMLKSSQDQLSFLEMVTINATYSVSIPSPTKLMDSILKGGVNNLQDIALPRH